MDMGTDCSKRGKPEPRSYLIHKFGYKAGIYVAVTGNPNFAATLIPDVLDDRSRFLMGFALGYRDGRETSEDESEGADGVIYWADQNLLPELCVACDCLERCYTKSKDKDGKEKFTFNL